MMNIKQPAEHLNLPFVTTRGINRGNPTSVDENRRLKIVQWLPASIRNHFVAWLGEFVGTFLFLFFAFSATKIANFAPTAAKVSNAPNTADLLYIALAFGFSLAVNAWVFFRITGGLFNPAVTFGLCLIGAVTWLRGGIVFTAQIIGAIAASAVVSGLFPGPMPVTTSLNASTSIVRGLFIEMFLTAELVFTIFMLAAEKHKATFLAPVGIGLALFIAELSGVYFTGGSLNPARSFGPAVVTGSFDDYHWIYWLGPLLGSLIAVLFYKLVKGLEYETVNPGQDAGKDEAEHFENHESAPQSVPIANQAAMYSASAPVRQKANGLPLSHVEPKPLSVVNKREHSAV